jgi:hypothetical protein
MTCIIGIEHPGGVLIGGDSAASAEQSIIVRTDAKVFATGPYAIGFTDSYRMGQLLRYKLNPPLPTAEDLDDLDRFMATSFVDAVRHVLMEGGYAKISENREEGGDFLVGIAGRLYAIEGDFQMGRNAAGYEALGSGRDLALGSLHTSAEFDLTPKDRAQYALSAASEFNTGVSPPFVIFNAPAELDV